MKRKIIIAAILSLFLMTSVFAYVGGGGFIYLTPWHRTKEGNLLQHLVMVDAKDYQYGCNEKQRIIIDTEKKLLGVTQSDCTDDYYITEVVVNYDKKYRYAYFDIYTIMGPNSKESFEAMLFFNIKSNKNYDKADLYVDMGLANIELYQKKGNEWVIYPTTKQGDLYKFTIEKDGYFAVKTK